MYTLLLCYGIRLHQEILEKKIVRYIRSFNWLCMCHTTSASSHTVGGGKMGSNYCNWPLIIIIRRFYYYYSPSYFLQDVSATFILQCRLCSSYMYHHSVALNKCITLITPTWLEVRTKFSKWKRTRGRSRGDQGWLIWRSPGCGVIALGRILTQYLRFSHCAHLEEMAWHVTIFML